MSEWERKTIGEVCSVVNGGTPKTKIKEYWNGKHAWITPAEMGKRESLFVTETARTVTDEGLANSSAKLLPPSSVILSSRAPIGHVVINSVPMATNQGCKGLVPKKNLDERFLALFLIANVPLLNRLGTGATFKELSSSKLKTVHIPLPPLAEQKRIVSILDEAFAAIERAKENAEKNLANARELFDSYLNSVLQGNSIRLSGSEDDVQSLLHDIDKMRADAVREKRAKQLKKGWDKPILSAKIPDHWEWIQLDRLSSKISDGVHKKPKYVSKGVPFITIKNLTGGAGISFDDVKFVTEADHESYVKRTNPEKGDILITKDGTIGVVRLIDVDVEFSIFVSVALIKPLCKKMSRFLVYALQSSLVQGQIIPQGTALKHLYLTDLRRMAIPVPPLTEQFEIVRKLDSISAHYSELESIYQQKLANLDELKQSLLQKAFTGQLTTQQLESEVTV